MPIEIVTGAAAQANVVSQPANVLLYGGPGMLKSTDAVAAFIRPDGTNGAFVIPCEDGALKPIAARGWMVPDHPKQTVKSWGQMVEAIAWLGQNRDRYSGVIVDGLTPFASYIYKEAEAHHKGNKNKFAIPMQVRDCLFQLREWLRMLGLHSVLIGHALAPAVIDGIFYQGAFGLSPKTIVPEYFGQIDTVLRVDYLQLLGRPPIRVYCTGGPEWPPELGVPMPPDWNLWRVKNREGCIRTCVPADLGAFLRGRQPPYLGL